MGEEGSKRLRNGGGVGGGSMKCSVDRRAIDTTKRVGWGSMRGQGEGGRVFFIRKRHRGIQKRADSWNSWGHDGG